MTKTLLDAVHDTRRTTSDIAQRLEGIADAMSYLGLMEPVVMRLIDCAEELRASGKELSAAYSIDLNEKVRHSQAVTGGMLKLALNDCLTAPAKREKTA